MKSFALDAPPRPASPASVSPPFRGAVRLHERLDLLLALPRQERALVERVPRLPEARGILHDLRGNLALDAFALVARHLLRALFLRVLHASLQQPVRVVRDELPHAFLVRLLGSGRERGGELRARGRERRRDGVGGVDRERGRIRRRRR
eukprot:31430-Pelagococcus_subviridis.AAC.10